MVSSSGPTCSLVLILRAADTEKLKRAQGGGRVEGQSTTANEKADRVLSKIRQKLRPDLSVEYTVNQLIQEARDPDNLAKIFVGK
jgi:ataxia telangiectasia mutated family protein